MPATPASSENFVHLHNHTEFSMLDGAARVDDLFAKAAELGMPALATTDHGYLFGAYDFWKAGRTHGVKPIIGLEAYVAPGAGTPRTHKAPVFFGGPGDNRRDDVSGAGAYTHMTLLARDDEGMHNLFRMGSQASLDGYYKKPRIDTELLQRHGAGLIGTTGCPSGEVQTRLRLGQYDQAIRAAADLRDVLGAENYYCEVMDHGNEIERRVRTDLLRLAKDLGLPLVATNDLHYTHESDAEAHGALLCIQTGSTLLDPNRFAFEGSGYHLRTAAEMRQVFRELPEACDNTLVIAERCEVSFTEGEGRYMPRFPCPEGEDESSWFVAEVERGLTRRYPGGVSDAVRRRAEYETQVIVGKGYAGYFLVVADFIQWAKAHDIRVGPGRGSGAGSMCAYVLGITDLDPLVHGLVFERFLNPERMSMPDFDIDFDERRRSEVIAYVTQKYGDDRVAMIATYGRLKSKAALKDAARVLGHPFAMGERLTKIFPEAAMGKDAGLSVVDDPANPRYDEGAELRQFLAEEPEAGKVFETAKGLEGLVRQWGVHAAGVIMSSEPLIDLVPIMRRDQDGQVLTQFDYPMCEALGLVKMDFLGLRNLTVLDDAISNVRDNRQQDVDLDELSLDLNDAATYELLGRGETLGVFQLDGGGTQSLLRLMRPDTFEDISATIALYRPGPMGVDSHLNYALRKNGRQPITPIHPDLDEPLKEILEPNHGLIVYQEDVILAAQKVAGYTMGRADLLRKAMGKKKKEVLDAEYAGFQEGMRGQGFGDDAIKALWETLMPFADYGFGKAHAKAYALISYWTAYLKAHYPAEYMAALLTSVRDDKDKTALYLGECRRMRISVLPPDVNESIANFAAVGDDIRFGLAAVRNVGSTVVARIVAAREAKGAFTSFEDFLRTCDAVVCNKRTIEALIKAGAFDSLGHPRQGLVAIHEAYVDALAEEKRHEAQGQESLFAGLMGGDDADGAGGLVVLPPIPHLEWDKKPRLAFEREMLGLYVSDHPLNGIAHLLAQHASTSIPALRTESGVKDRDVVTVAGLITSVQLKRTKKGDLWAVAVLEDLEGSVECLLFPQVYREVAAVLAPDTVCVVRGRVDKGDERLSLHVQDFQQPEISEGPRGPVVLSVPTMRFNAAYADKLGQVLGAHPGTTEVHLRLTGEGRVLHMQLADTLRVEATPGLFGDLKANFGTAVLAS